ncbi:unnamed protein product [Strongylus vulgaris]|uniref:Uncharacterized protein n=1 Tax=Strongylus vulgaris TaxID=40348 RepID=A0A3P7I3F9_STRVU|nr:unnamed protein product [Strongylus vulgaris]
MYFSSVAADNTAKLVEGSSILLLNSGKKPKKPAIESIQPSGILGRLRSFLPQIATANQELSSNDAEKVDVDVIKVDSDIEESDTSTDDADSSEEVESDEVSTV